MFYKFPVIKNIEQARKAIAGREEFIEADKGDYIVFNYLVNFEDTFPPVNSEDSDDAKIRRECRGLIFDKYTGKVIARRYHKFFNLGEKKETLSADLNFNGNYGILEKLDGSMITPFRTSVQESMDGFHFHVGTKMGVTDVSANAKMFIDDNEHYQEFIMTCLENDFTPIFEWCSRKNRIVVDYPEDRLVLTAVRHNETGEYWPYLSMLLEAGDYDIEIVDEYCLSASKAIETLKEIQDAEGYIIRFNNGHMLKLKGDWYLQLHKTLEHIQHEKDLIRLIVDEKLDDAKPFLPADLVEKLDRFGAEFFMNVKNTANNLTWEFIEDLDRSKNSKKDFAERVKIKKESALLFKIYDAYQKDENLNVGIANLNQFTYALILDKIKNSLATASKVESVRHYFGNINWHEYV